MKRWKFLSTETEDLSLTKIWKRILNQKWLTMNNKNLYRSKGIHTPLDFQQVSKVPLLPESSLAWENSMKGKLTNQSNFSWHDLFHNHRVPLPRQHPSLSRMYLILTLSLYDTSMLRDMLEQRSLELSKLPFLRCRMVPVETWRSAAEVERLTAMVTASNK